MPASFYEDLQRFDSKVALVDESGHETTYAELRAAAELFAERLGRQRRVVFLEARRSAPSIAAYLGCLIGRHAVHLFGEQDDDTLRALAERYRPNVLVHSRADACDVEWMYGDEHELHPRLRVLLSTSGTTGSPKFVKLSHENLQSNAEAIASYLALEPNERAVTTLDFSYSYGLSVLHSHLACGASLLLSERSVSEPEFWSAFASGRATSFAGVPYTFEMLERASVPWSKVRGLRYITQAGGRLAPRLVQRMAELADDGGWRFFVMYGQTEASPRIAYLPPERAREFPDCIGVPVPGGETKLVDDHGRAIDALDVPGELLYRGPNVMLGYARSAKELASDETPAWLRTGDLAVRNSAGLLQIVGRSARFVKPFGLRVNLDEVEAHARASEPSALCAGTDECIVVALEGETNDLRAARLASELARRYALPERTFNVVFLREPARLANGKPDYGALSELASSHPRPALRAPGWQGVARLVLSPRFAVAVWQEARGIIGLTRNAWSGVAEIYRTLLKTDAVADHDSFVDLHGDSLSYVAAAVALEQYLGRLPHDWPRRTIAELEQERDHATAL